MTAENRISHMSRKIGTWIASLCLASGVLSGTQPAQAAEDTISVGVIAKDGSGLVPTLLSEDQELQEKMGIKLVVKAYPSVPAVWTAFAAGETDTLIGGPANFLAMAQRGAPVHIFATYASFNADLFGKKKIETAEDLRGKRVAAITAGFWRVTEAQIKNKFGLSAGTDYEIIPAPNLLTGVTQVLAGTVDYAMGWEPESTRVRNTYPDLVVALSSSDLRPSGDLSIPQVIASRLPAGDDREKKMIDALAAMTDIVLKDPVAAEAKFSSLTGAETGVFSKSVEAGRYNIIVRKPSESDKASIMADMLSTIEPGSAVPDGFME